MLPAATSPPIRRFGVAPSLTFGLGTPTRLTLSYLHEQADDTPDYGIPWLFNGPAPVDRHNYYGFRHGNFLRTDVDVATAKVEHDFSSSIRLRNQARYGHYKRNAQITEAKIAGTPTLDTPLEDMTRHAQPDHCQQPRDISRRSARRHIPVQHGLR